MPGAVMAGVSVITFNNRGQVLLGLRKSSHGAGTWSFPGGWMEVHETPFQTAQREVKEETGMIITDPCPFVVPWTSTYFHDAGFHVVTLFITAGYKSGELQVKEPQKCALWQWFFPEELPSPLFEPLLPLLKIPLVHTLGITWRNVYSNMELAL